MSDPIKALTEFLFPSIKRRREKREIERQRRWAEYEKQAEESRASWAKLDQWQKEREEECRKRHLFKRKLKSLRNRAKFHRASMRPRP
jgi:hypothetical protein